MKYQLESCENTCKEGIYSLDFLFHIWKLPEELFHWQYVLYLFVYLLNLAQWYVYIAWRLLCFGSWLYCKYKGFVLKFGKTFFLPNVQFFTFLSTNGRKLILLNRQWPLLSNYYDLVFHYDVTPSPAYSSADVFPITLATPHQTIYFFSFFFSLFFFFGWGGVVNFTLLNVQFLNLLHVFLVVL